MKALSGHEIRAMWIKFFEEKGHKWLPGVSLVPVDDKSLLWVNAGVTGLKKYFDGSEVPPCRRIVNVQKSIRTNDIENVGKTARHHTFFEMLGNFSIGDYFRKEAIAWAFEILTSPKWFGFDPEKLYMTYNPTDLESLQYWQDQGVKKDHLIPLAGNYWQIGEGPCGPNTEVFYDRGEKWDPKHLGVSLLADDIENDRYIELWGIVFSQFNAVNGVARENYKELPSKNIDTGSGLERLACIMQGTDTNFETDLFMPIIKAAEKISGYPYEEPNLMSYRVIADHARTLTFALGDGASFSNEGRGYVLRRIIRRAMRYGQKIGIKDPFMYKLVKVVADSYKDFYPELEGKVGEVAKMVKSEEDKFIKTLNSGEAMLREMLKDRKALSGSDVFKLYDTYGFPADLTKEIAAESGVGSDMDGFDKLMEEQKERARSARGEIESFHKQSKDLMAFKAPSQFVYGVYQLKAKAIGLFVDGVSVDSIDEKGEAVFDKTPFYAEMGGQVADAGTIENASFRADVISVGKSTNGQHLHTIEVKYGSLKIGDECTLSVRAIRRELIERNHSATHLLHAALGEVLHSHVDQKGSFVNDEYLRFDFAHNGKLAKEEIGAIEALVNEKIAAAIPQITQILPIEEATKLGAEAEFSEKYGSLVRVVSFDGFSKEFCGGTHVENTSEIGVFVVESEEAIASGVRRIQGRTSLGAYRYLSEKNALLSEAKGLLGGVGDADFLPHLGALKKNDADLAKEVSDLKDKLASAQAKSLKDEFVNVGGVQLLYKHFEGVGRNDLATLGDRFKANRSDYLIVLSGGSEGAVPLIVFAAGKALDKGFKAGDVLKQIAVRMGGSGGGRPEMASGQGKSLAAFGDEENALKERLGK